MHPPAGAFFLIARFETLKITVNGVGQEISDDMTISLLIEHMGIERAGTAVAINGEIISYDRHDETSLYDGDAVDVIRAIGGG
jgi:sulfur carrier protein